MHILKGGKVNKIDLRFTGRHLVGSKKINGERIFRVSRFSRASRPVEFVKEVH